MLKSLSVPLNRDYQRYEGIICEIITYILNLSLYKNNCIPFFAYVELHWITVVVDPLTRILSLQPPTVVARAWRWLVPLPVTQRQDTPTPHPPVMPLSFDVVYTNPKLFCWHTCITFRYLRYFSWACLYNNNNYIDSLIT